MVLPTHKNVKLSSSKMSNLASDKRQIPSPALSTGSALDYRLRKDMFGKKNLYKIFKGYDSCNI